MEWFENETFWRDFYPFMFDERRFANAPAEVDKILKVAGVDRGTVLDLCCGPARHSAVLADKGFRVTGVDRSPFLLSKAKEHAALRPIEFVEADMREFRRDGAFDLALSLFTSFGYFETRGEDLAVLRNIRASLKQDGVFVIDVISKEFVASQPARTHWHDQPDGSILVQHAKVLPGWSRVSIVWLLIRGDQVVRHEFEHTLYSAVEFRAVLEEAGFHDIEIFGSLDQTPYDGTVTRLVAKARA